MTHPVIVLGTGGHARVVVATLRLLGVQIIGMTDIDPAGHKEVFGVPVIGTDDVVLRFQPEEIRLVNGLGSTSLPLLRTRLFDRFKRDGYSFFSLIHPSAIIAADAAWGEGTQIMAGAIIQPGCRIGDNCILNTGVAVDHDCRIGNHVHLAPGVTLSGGVTVGDGVHVGTGAVVIQGIEIGDSCLVGAGAVVIDKVTANTKMVGVPAREVE
jgi:sugar O-acyltransferase (sialic acid O-acetyltransferase NeuD family)